MASSNDERLASPPLSQRIPIARLELSSKNGAPVNDELDAYSKALLVEFSWSDLSPPPPPNRVTTYTLEWDEKPIVLPILEEQRWEWDAPIEAPQEITYDGTNVNNLPTPTDDEDTVMLIALIPGTVPHISKVYLRQKRIAAVPPVSASALIEEEQTAPLEIPVKTLPQTYPLSSEFLGANYRYIAGLILSDVETSATKTRGSKRGILHTVFAMRRLEDLEAKINAVANGGSSKHAREEKAWLEEEFNITLERIAQARPLMVETPTDLTLRSAATDTPTSPTATAREWTSQATLASTGLGPRYEDPSVPWPTSPNLKFPSSGPNQANGGGTVATPSADGIKAIPRPSGAAGLGLVVGKFEGLNMKDDSRVTSSNADDNDDEDDDLFQLPISPR
ncbi:hypothetical protein H072_2019 [Dactylellina haptotyla CBS 200.50]|uniref:Uncharacterized protein n=1 Tax=Dactylellina haptotyla (strain CBS 200.50) TaxID=1284197 RepID=S8BWY2_DACHA|nr:hypothetical protein H072_2019 [Dactylellina haptotyla CBS 200.50]